jgi:23S rRNA pseudouridine2604 synthase
LPFTEKLSALGRLDKNSTGLLLLTNDGKIVNNLLNPEFNHEKEYLVTVDRRISSNFIKKMKEGVDIGGYVTKKARAKKLKDDTFSLVLTEGKNHQIKKMTNALGYTVRQLKRTRFNNIKLGDLKSGKYRIIEGKEYLKLIGKF